jgi:hypothetical protein
MPKLGLDAQKPDTRPATLGNAAMDADARFSLGRRGRVDPAGPEGKTQQLNLGDLSRCEDELRYRRGNTSKGRGRSQQRP